jgi:hypothetical protein
MDKQKERRVPKRKKEYTEKDIGEFWTCKIMESSQQPALKPTQ